MSFFKKLFGRTGASSPKPKSKPIGKVTHFYGNLGVAIVKFNKNVDTGSKMHFKGATTDFVEEVSSMQFNHQSIESAPKGKEVGIKVKGKVREGDLVYSAK